MINLSISFLKAKITKLEQDKELLRLFLHELIEAYWRAVNQEPKNDSETKSETVNCCSLQNPDHLYYACSKKLKERKNKHE